MHVRVCAKLHGGQQREGRHMHGMGSSERGAICMGWGALKGMVGGDKRRQMVGGDKRGLMVGGDRRR